ncbi:MAG: NUDIX hydrolase [Bacillota bacterium]
MMEEPVNSKGQTLGEFLEAYDENRYRRPSVTVDMAVFTLDPNREDGGLCVLLIRRGNHPYIGQWALPGGFVEMDEDLPAAAARELREETGLTGCTLRQFGAFGAVDRDPRTRVITIGYYALAPRGSLRPEAADDAADAALFGVRLERVGAGPEGFDYGLTLGGSCVVAARGKLGFDGLDETMLPVKGGELASDHAHLLFSALHALSRLPRENAVWELAGRKENLLQARRALDELF